MGIYKKLLWIGGLVVIMGCTKEYLDIGETLASELWENRPTSIACTPTPSPQTVIGNELSFETEHVLCVNIQMEDFETLRNESPFGPSILYENGTTAAAVAAQYRGQCDVPFPSEYNWYSGTFIVDGITLNNVGIRKNGFLNSIFSVAPSIKLKTDRYVEDQTIQNTERIHFNNNAADPSRLMQAINYKVFELANYPAPRCNLATVSVNGEALGIYSHVEVVQKEFLKRHFSEHKSDLYSGQHVDFIPEWIWRWEEESKHTDSLNQPILNIANVLESTDDAGLVEALRQYINIDKFITFWALEVLLNHKEGYTANHSNFYVFFDTNDNNRAIFIPDGMNYFEHTDEAQVFSNFVNAELPRRLSRIPETAQLFETELNRLLTEVWDKAALLTLVDNLAIQVQTGQNDEAYTTHVDQVKAWIQNRASEVTNLLVNGLPQGEASSNSCYEE